MKMGDKAIVEVETISSGSLGIDLALGVGWISKRSRLLKYTVQNLLEKTMTLHAIAEAQKKRVAVSMQNMHSTEIMQRN
jgi:recombination protein RecA